MFSVVMVRCLDVVDSRLFDGTANAFAWFSWELFSSITGQFEAQITLTISGIVKTKFVYITSQSIN